MTQRKKVLAASILAGVGSCQAYPRGAERHGSGQQLPQRRFYQLQPPRQPALRRSRGRMGRHFSRAAAELRQRPCRTAHHRVARQAADGSGGLLRRNRTATAKFRRAGIGHVTGIPAIRLVPSRTRGLHQGRPGPRQSSGRQSPAGRQGAPPAGGKKRAAARPRRRAGIQFYRVDPASGRARDLLLDPSADALQVFRARVDDVAQDLSRLLGSMAASGGAAAAARQLPPPTRCFWPGPPAT